MSSHSEPRPSTVRISCPKNAAYAERCGQAFLAGKTPDNFAPEHYEAGWTGRPGPAT